MTVATKNVALLILVHSFKMQICQIKSAYLHVLRCVHNFTAVLCFLYWQINISFILGLNKKSVLTGNISTYVKNLHHRLSPRRGSMYGTNDNSALVLSMGNKVPAQLDKKNL